MNDLLHGNNAWIGGYRSENNHQQWTWIDGYSPAWKYLSKDFFDNGEPNNANSNEYCLMMNGSNGKINDVPCIFAQKFVCQKSSL